MKEKEIIVMDELGRFELNSPAFQQKVHILLDSKKIVLGVIKSEKNFFLESIKNRKDINLYQIHRNNRNKIHHQINLLINKFNIKN